MKFLGATILVILCANVLYANDKDGTYVPPTCCFTYISRQIPRNYVVAYFKTSSLCPGNGVVFLTKRRRQICANPSDAWVQEYINNIKEIPQDSFPMDSRDAD